METEICLAGVAVWVLFSGLLSITVSLRRIADHLGALVKLLGGQDDQDR